MSTISNINIQKVIFIFKAKMMIADTPEPNLFVSKIPNRTSKSGEYENKIYLKMF